ncbi:hypothetical protein D3C86_1393010 [compost metagenome]
MLDQVLGDGIALVGADLVLFGLLQAGQADVAVASPQQHPVIRADRADPFEQRLALGQSRGDEHPVPRLLQRQLVDALPGEAQGHAVVDPGTLEHLAYDIHGNAVKIVFLSEVLAVARHVVRREVLGEQHHAVVRRQFGVDASGQPE